LKQEVGGIKILTRDVITSLRKGGGFDRNFNFAKNHEKEATFFSHNVLRRENGNSDRINEGGRGEERNRRRRRSKARA